MRQLGTSQCAASANFGPQHPASWDARGSPTRGSFQVTFLCFLREENNRGGPWSLEILIRLETASFFLLEFYLYYMFFYFRESCGEGSVKILEERLKQMGFQYSCINDHL